MSKAGQPRIGVALGSGIARGWAHIGVLKGLERQGIRPDIVCGTSVGAFIGAAYAAGCLDAVETWARDPNNFRLTRVFDFQFAQGGLIAGRRMMQIFEDKMPDAMIEELPLRFACVCTDLETGHEVWVQDGSLNQAVRASSAVPGILPPVQIDGRWLVDGALVNPIPVSVCRALGAHVVIAVDLNTDVFEARWQRTASEFEDTATSAVGTRLNALPGADFIGQLFRHQKHAPSILGVMARSLDIIQSRISRTRLASDPPDIIVAPGLGDIGMLQFDRAAAAIEAGEAAVEASLAALHRALPR